MPISYPLSIPAALKPKSVYPRVHKVVARNTSPFTGEAQTYVHAGEFWLLDLEFAPVAQNDAADAIDFYQDLHGLEGSFNFDISPYAMGNTPAWATATKYEKNEFVSNSASNYRCLVAHTSATFSTDLSDGKWALASNDITFQLRSQKEPGFTVREGTYNFDKLICEEVVT